jgi:Zn finger protein HypA/HybF involved in hydrogenase expression
MHELSIANEICRMAEARLGSKRCRDLLTVGLHVGSDAGVEFENLQFCLDVLLQQPPFGRARLELQTCAGDVLSLSYLEVDDADSYD